MNLKEFADFCNSRYTLDRVPMRAANLATNAELTHALLGLSGETGELVDVVKKHLMYNRPLDQKAALLECGDVLHSIFRVIECLNFSVESVMDAHKTKLQERDRTNQNHYMSDSQLVADLNAVLQEQLDKARQTNGL